MSEADTWPKDLFRLLKTEGISQVALVPDAGHAQLIWMCLADHAIRVVTLTTEEEGVAMLSGAWMGGAKGVLLMQSSGRWQLHQHVVVAGHASHADCRCW